MKNANKYNICKKEFTKSKKTLIVGPYIVYPRTVIFAVLIISIFGIVFDNKSNHKCNMGHERLSPFQVFVRVLD